MYKTGMVVLLFAILTQSFGIGIPYNTKWPVRSVRRYNDDVYRNIMNYQQRMDELDGTLGLQRYIQNLGQ